LQCHRKGGGKKNLYKHSQQYVFNLWLTSSNSFTAIIRAI
jgi:hypothetical protein